MASEYAGYLSDRAAPDRTGRDLTPPELANLRWYAHGLTERDIAAVRVVAVDTIHTQMKSVRAKLAAKTVAHAVAIAMRHGLIS